MNGNSKFNRMTLFAALAILVIAGVTGALTLTAGAQKDDEGKAQQQAQDSVQNKTTQDAWTHRCSGEGEQKGCEIAQRLSVKESGKRVVEMAVARITPEGGDKTITRAVLVVPLGVAVQPGIKIRVDDNDETYSADIAHCRQDGCYAYLQIPDKLLKSMKAGKNAKLAMAAQQGKQINIPLSLMGFTDAYNKLVQ